MLRPYPCPSSRRGWVLVRARMAIVRLRARVVRMAVLRRTQQQSVSGYNNTIPNPFQPTKHFVKNLYEIIILTLPRQLIHIIMMARRAYR